MRVSNIQNNISFGKTVRVSMPENEAYNLVNLINSKVPSPRKFNLQQEAKAIFDDTKQGKAVVYKSHKGDAIYILSGNEATSLDGIKKKEQNVRESVCEYFDDGPILDRNLQIITTKTNLMISELIKSTRENFVLALRKSDDKSQLYKISVVG